MSEMKGFKISIRDNGHTLKISNTEKDGCVTFKDSDSSVGINLADEKFLELVKYLDVEAAKIKKKIKSRKPEADIKVEGVEEAPEAKKERKPRKKKKILTEIPALAEGLSEEKKDPDLPDF